MRIVLFYIIYCGVAVTLNTILYMIMYYFIGWYVVPAAMALHLMCWRSNRRRIVQAVDNL